MSPSIPASTPGGQPRRLAFRPLSKGRPIHPIASIADCYLDRTQLFARGWTDALIRVHLPDPCPRPGHRPRKARRSSGPSPRTRPWLRSFLEAEDGEGAGPGLFEHGARAAPGAGDRPAPSAPSGWRRWHIHRVDLVERTEHFIHDYARSLRRRGASRARIRGYHLVRVAMARGFRAYRLNADLTEIIHLIEVSKRHHGAIEAAAGMRFTRRGA